MNMIRFNLILQIIGILFIGIGIIINKNQRPHATASLVPLSNLFIIVGISLIALSFISTRI